MRSEKIKRVRKIKKKFINKDLSNVEIVQLKQLIATRNDFKKKLEEAQLISMV